MRSEMEIKRAKGVLTGVHFMSQAAGAELPQICPSQFQALCLALDWALGNENPFGTLIEGFMQTFAESGTGIDEVGRPYQLNRTN